MIAYGPLKTLSYHEDLGALFLTFTSGRQHTFFNVGPEVYIALVNSRTRDRTMADHRMWEFRWFQTWPCILPNP